MCVDSVGCGYIGKSKLNEESIAHPIRCNAENSGWSQFSLVDMTIALNFREILAKFAYYQNLTNISAATMKTNYI